MNKFYASLFLAALGGATGLQQVFHVPTGKGLRGTASIVRARNLKWNDGINGDDDDDTSSAATTPSPIAPTGSTSATATASGAGATTTGCEDISGWEGKFPCSFYTSAAPGSAASAATQEVATDPGSENIVSTFPAPSIPNPSTTTHPGAATVPESVSTSPDTTSSTSTTPPPNGGTSTPPEDPTSNGDGNIDNASSGGFGVCFSGKNTVEVLGNGRVSIDSIKIGDSVRVGPGNEFAQVYSFGHYAKNVVAEYVRIRTNVSASPLELTKDHMVFVQEGSFSKSVPASAVNVGDKLIVANGGVTEIRKIERVTSRGAFAPFTKTGTIVVSDIVASNYISLLDETPVSMQWMAHAFNAPHRMVCALSFEICENETYTNGISNWVYNPFQFGLWLAQQNAAVKFSVCMAFIVFFGIFSFIEQMTVSPLLLGTAVVACLVFMNKKTNKANKTKSI